MKENQNKTITLHLDPVSAHIVADILDYDLSRLEDAEQRDPFKDNGYLKNAIKDFLKAYEDAKK